MAYLVSSSVDFPSTRVRLDYFHNCLQLKITQYHHFTEGIFPIRTSIDTTGSEIPLFHYLLLARQILMVLPKVFSSGNALYKYLLLYSFIQNRNYLFYLFSIENIKYFDIVHKPETSNWASS